MPGEASGRYSGSSETFGDEDKHHLNHRKHSLPEQNSSSSIGEMDKQDQRIPHTDRDDLAINDSPLDLEKGDTGSPEQTQVNQEGQEKGQVEWKDNVVGWDGPNDPQNPQNWSLSRKYTTTVFYASLTFCITFSSSIFSTATMVTAKLYGVSNEVMTLGTSVFVFVSAHSQPHPSRTDTWNRGLPLAQLYGVPSPNSMVERFLSSSDSSVSPSFKSPWRWPKTSKRSC